MRSSNTPCECRIIALSVLEVVVSHSTSLKHPCQFQYVTFPKCCGNVCVCEYSKINTKINRYTNPTGGNLINRNVSAF